MSKSSKIALLTIVAIIIGVAGVSFYSNTYADRGNSKESHGDMTKLFQKSQVTIYSTTTCPYCYKAKDLLKDYNISYIEKDLSNQENLREFMTKLPNVRGVPQIFIGNEHVGGYSELKDLADSEQLLRMVSR